MKLVSSADGCWQYHLRANEAEILRSLLGEFPFTGTGEARISMVDTEPETLEREKWLNESLQEHRQELKKMAATLLAPERWEKQSSGYRLKLDAGAREQLLQILNDIRVSLWQELGAPESLDVDPQSLSQRELVMRQIMELAGFFQMNLLDPE